MRESFTSSPPPALRRIMGPFALLLLTFLMISLPKFGLNVPNPGLVYMSVVMALTLTEPVPLVIVNLVLGLAATLLFYWYTNRFETSGDGVIRLTVCIASFTVGAAIIFKLRRRLEKVLGAPLASERSLFQAVMTAMHDAIVETDWKGIREVNPAFCKLSGFTREELIGTKPPYPFWPAEQYAVIAAALETAMRGRALDFELVLNRKNGERFPVLLSVSRILDGGTTNRILYSFRDITELKKAQDEAKVSQRKLQHAIDCARMGVWEWDVLLKRLYWSGFLESMWGMTPGEFDGTVESCLKRIHPDDTEMLSRVILDARANRSVFTVEFRVIWPDGTVRWIASSGAHKFNDQGHVLSISGVAHDITERRRTQALLAAEGTILQSIATGMELDPTLHALAIMIEGLLPGSLCAIMTVRDDGKRLHVQMAPHLPDQFNRAAEGFVIGPGQGTCGTAAFTGERVITGDIQNDPSWSKWKQIAATFGLGSCMSEPIRARGGHVLGTFAIYHREPRTVDAAEFPIVETAAQLAAVAIERDRSKRELHAAKDDAETANRTKDRFINLLSHELRSPLTPILTLASVLKSDIRLPEDLRRDMEIIRRNAEVEARLVDELLELVRKARGTLAADIESNIRDVTHGTQTEQPRTDPAGLPAKRALRILFVEDHDDSRTIIARLLEREGHTVTTASTVATAVALATSDEFDFLLSDISVSGESGIDLLKKINIIRPLPAIALSGLGSAVDAQRSLDSGFLLHLTKPVNFHTLHDAIQRFCS